VGGPDIDPSTQAAWLAVGRVSRAHGVKGEVAVQPLSEVEARFQPGSRVFASEDETRPLVVAGARPHRHRLLVSFHGITDRSGAQELTGKYLFVPATQAPSLPEGEFWPHQLVGCDVWTDRGRRLGAIREVMRTPANDIWAADGEGGEVLIPALRDVVVSVDVAGRRVVVREVPGLTVP
jgi:16S rRNA processing protein RimM